MGRGNREEGGVKFWDSSAITPLAVREPHTDALKTLLAVDGHMVVWWRTMVECASAFARQRRDGAFSAADERQALAVLEGLTADLECSHRLGWGAGARATSRACPSTEGSGRT